MAPPPTSLVYRLRGIPSRIDSHTQAAQLLGWALDQPVSEIQVYSLATVTVSSWTGTTRTATVMFEEMPRIVQNSPDQDEWTIIHPRLQDNLLLDSHFRGMTPLHDVLPPHNYEYNCIAISGLSSHPFGSWQPRGGRKEFMWLRDEFPNHHPTMRLWIHGYDTDLADTTSFQSISDLSISLINHLEAPDFASPTAPRILVLAHSLGGIVFKEAISNLARGGEKSLHILHLIRGAMLFGVPNLGMEQSHLQTLVQHQPNRSLVEDLAIGAPYLIKLDERFLAHKSNQRMNVFWAYETRTSGIVEADENGEIRKCARRKILVSRESATSNLVSRCAHLTIPINKDHSSIVKYHRNDEDCSRVLLKIRELVDSIVAPPYETPSAISGSMAAESSIGDPQAQPDAVASSSGQPNQVSRQTSHLEKTLDSVPADMLASSLYVPELSQRHDGIDIRELHTFEWIFENDELAFTKWLRSEEKFYWIRGKPGSGKSTLMKFIVDDPRTRELLINWKNTEEPMIASFFFHHRGSVLQKSLDGLIRSILAQVLEQQPQLAHGLSSVIEDLVGARFPLKERELSAKLGNKVWKQGELWKMLCHTLGQKLKKLDICLFFDALDEYDGSPPVIKDFLEALEQVSSSGMTRLKVCCSSRPWEIFKQSYSRNIPGFSIHHYTTDDIQRYCYQTLAKCDQVAGIVASLVPEITKSARGVFLWAGLALKDLIEAGRSTTDPGRLREKLESLPKELKSYYEEIVKRCQQWLRVKTYGLLEIVTRSDKVLTPSQVLLALACSSSPSFDACRGALENTNIETLGIEHARKLISNACGRLLEIKKSGRAWYVQLMHQTVREFVLDPKFKTLVLGDGAKFQHENGHSFLSKFYLTQRGIGLTPQAKYFLCNSIASVDEVIRHLREAEMTTGKSQAQFLTSFTPGLLSAVLHDRDWTTPYTPGFPYAQYKFAMDTGLHLCADKLIKQQYPTNQDKESALVESLSRTEGHKQVQPLNAQASRNFLLLLGFEPKLDDPLARAFVNNRLRLLCQGTSVRLPSHPEHQDEEIEDGAQFPSEYLPKPDPQGLVQQPLIIVQIHENLLELTKTILVSKNDPATDPITPFNLRAMICNPAFVEWLFQEDRRERTLLGVWPTMFIEWAVVFWSMDFRGQKNVALALRKSTVIILEEFRGYRTLLVTNTTAWPSARRNLLEWGTQKSEAEDYPVLDRCDPLIPLLDGLYTLDGLDILDRRYHVYERSGVDAVLPFVGLFDENASYESYDLVPSDSSSITDDEQSITDIKAQNNIFWNSQRPRDIDPESDDSNDDSDGDSCNFEWVWETIDRQGLGSYGNQDSLRHLWNLWSPEDLVKMRNLADHNLGDLDAWDCDNLSLVVNDEDCDEDGVIWEMVVDNDYRVSA